MFLSLIIIGLILILSIVFIAIIVKLSLQHGTKQPSTSPDHVHTKQPSTSPDHVHTKQPSTSPDHVSVKKPFIRWDSRMNRFFNQATNETFYILGFNAHWLGLIPGSPEYPSTNAIESAFKMANKHGAKVIRSISLGFSVGTPASLLPSTQGPINDSAWAPIDTAFRMAKKYDVRLIVAFLDPYKYYTGSMWEYLKPYGIQDKSQFYTDPRIKKDFKNYLHSYLNHQIDGIKMLENPYLLMLELGNELDDHNFPRVPIPWLQEMSSYVRSLDADHLILCPMDIGITLLSTKDIQDQLPFIDVFSQHYYNYSKTPSCRWCLSADNKNQLRVVSQKVRDAKKAYIIGEYASCYANPGCDALEFFASMETSITRSIQGDLFWEYVYKGATFGTARQEKCLCRDDGDYQDIDEDSDLWPIFSQHWKNIILQAQPDINPGPDAGGENVLTIISIGDSITAGYNCGTRVPGKGVDQCSGATRGRVCINQIEECDFSQPVMVNKEQKYTDSFFSDSDFFPNCSLSYLDFLASTLQQKGYPLRLYNMGISGAQAGGCPSFNQSYRITGVSTSKQLTYCWDKIIKKSIGPLSQPLLILYMLGTNDAIKPYVKSCFGDNLEAATQSYFNSVLLMLSDLRKSYPHAYLVVMRPIKNYAFQVQGQVYDEMINNKYSGLKSFLQQSDLLREDTKWSFIDLWDFTDKEVPESESTSFLCDYTHPMDNLNQKIGHFLANEIEDKILKDKIPKGNIDKSSFFKCSI